MRKGINIIDYEEHNSNKILLKGIWKKKFKEKFAMHNFLAEKFGKDFLLSFLESFFKSYREKTITQKAYKNFVSFKGRVFFFTIEKSILLIL